MTESYKFSTQKDLLWANTPEMFQSYESRPADHSFDPMGGYDEFRENEQKARESFFNDPRNIMVPSKYYYDILEARDFNDLIGILVDTLSFHSPKTLQWIKNGADGGDVYKTEMMAFNHTNFADFDDKFICYFTLNDIIK